MCLYSTLKFFYLVFFASLSAPLIIRNIITTIEDSKKTVYDGLIWAFLFFLAQLVSYFGSIQYYFYMDRISLQVKSLLSSMLYRKGLKLSSASAAAQSPAEIVNYISIDANKISGSFYYFYNIVMLPVNMISSLALLYSLIGWRK